MSWFWEYIRMASYALVLSISIFSLKCPKQNRLLILANIIFSLGGFLSLFHPMIFGSDPVVTRNWTVTPTVVLWAVLNFISFFKKK
jgi:hypothetical protein